MMNKIRWLILLIYVSNRAEAQGPILTQKSSSIEVYDFQELTIRINPKGIANPFTDIAVKGEFIQGSIKVSVSGFCDSEDGSTYK